MRILFITARADWGGGPEHLHQLLTGLPEDVEAWVACPKDEPYWERFVASPITRGMLAIPHRAFGLGPLRRVTRLIRREKLDLIHSHGKGAGLFARPAALFTGRPCVHTFHGVHVGEYGALKKLAYVLFERTMGLFTRQGIAVSQGELDRILNLGLIGRKKLRLIPNGVPIPETLVSPPEQSERLPVVSISRFDYQKNSEFLLPIMEELERAGILERFQFVLVGDGPGRPKLEQAILERWGADAARFTGPLPDPGKELTRAFCYLSTARWEGLPLAVLETMALGLPPVVTDVPGNSDAVGQAGMLFAQGDARAAAQALLTLAEDRDTWARLSTLATQRVRTHFSKQGMVDKTYSAYQAMLERTAKV